VAAATAAERRERVQRVIVFAADEARVLAEHLPERRGGHAARSAHEQRQLQRLLETSDALAEALVADTEGLRGLADAAVIQHCQEVLELSDLHRGASLATRRVPTAGCGAAPPGRWSASGHVAMITSRKPLA